jgi:hypothetical protein
MATFTPNFRFDEMRHFHYVEEVPMALHCHHYLGGFFRMVDQNSYVDGKAIMYNSAEKTIKNHLTIYFQNNKAINTDRDKLAVGADAVRKFGFGTLDFSEVTETGGIVKAPTSHVAKVLRDKLGGASKVGNVLTAGLIAGILAAVYKRKFIVTEDLAFVNNTDMFTFKAEV